MTSYKRLPWDPSKRYKVFKPAVPATPKDALEGVIGFTPDSGIISASLVFPDNAVCVMIERHKIHFLKIVPVNN